MRIRTVKPAFFKDYRLFKAEQESELPLRLAYEGLWGCADREGRFKWEPEELKVDVLPYDDADFSRVLDALTTRGFLVRYTSAGRDFGWIPKFREHQVINNRESESTLPSPPKNTKGNNGIQTREPRVDDASSTPLVQEQGEGKGREGKGSIRSCVRFEEFWEAWPEKRRLEKKKTKEVWERNNLDEKANTIIEDVKNRITSVGWVDVKFIPHPHRYLSGERWNDEIGADNEDRNYV